MKRELLSSTESIVWRWKEYFEGLLYPTKKHSEVAAEPAYFGLGSLSTGVQVTGAVKQLCSASASGVDEIHPELLKALDAVGLSWLTRLCKIVLTSGTLPLE